MRWALLALAVVACACDDRQHACAQLVARCPEAGNAEACAGELAKQGPLEARRTRACIEGAQTCPRAAACLLPASPGSGWTDYAPYTK